MLQLLWKVWSDDDGQDIAEYALMLTVILLIVAATVSAISAQNPDQNMPPRCEIILFFPQESPILRLLSFGNLASKLLLHVENVLKFPIELTAPELCVVHYIHQFRLDNQSLAHESHC